MTMAARAPRRPAPCVSAAGQMRYLAGGAGRVYEKHIAGS